MSVCVVAKSMAHTTSPHCTLGETRMDGQETCVQTMQTRQTQAQRGLRWPRKLPSGQLKGMWLAGGRGIVGLRSDSLGAPTAAHWLPPRCRAPDSAPRAKTKAASCGFLPLS